MKYSFFFLVFTSVLFSCKTNVSNTFKDSPNEGTIRISVEQSFKPFMEEHFKVFAASFPKTNIIVSYKSEIDCFKDLAKDSTRMILVNRGLNKEEQLYYEKALNYRPNFGILAYNAIAVLIHKNAKDSVFTMDDLRQRLLGKVKQALVMDGNNLTGVVRFLKDSLVKSNTLGKNVMAAKGSQEVIEYIIQHPDAMGFLGMNWIGDGYDPKQAAYRNQVKMALVECTLCTEPGFFAKPSPSTISKGQYSLTLPIYYILKENAPGLGTGLLNFMSLERGQLLFKRSFLVPAKMGFKKRTGLLD